MNFFESPTFESGLSGSRITAATTNGPAYAPRPASSTPTILVNPFAQRVASTVELLLLLILLILLISYFVAGLLLDLGSRTGIFFSTSGFGKNPALLGGQTIATARPTTAESGTMPLRGSSW